MLGQGGKSKQQVLLQTLLSPLLWVHPTSAAPPPLHALSPPSLPPPPQVGSPDWCLGLHLLHCEGYCLYRPQLAKEMMQAAKAAGALVSMDLASFEVREGQGGAPDQL